jgi:hydroxymethylbilane synthase
MRLKIAARKSDLARLQARLVGERLRQAYPELEIDYLFKESLGDVNLSDPLWKAPEKGVFTEDFYQDLVQGRSDIVVHSWKDLPIVDKPETVIAGTLERADARDLLLIKKTARVEKPKHLKILSSSPRRVFLGRLNP